MKTNPIGVRFDQDMLDKLNERGLAKTPQKALNFLYEFWLESLKLKVIADENDKRMLDIMDKIGEIQKETIPEQRNTYLGRKSWELDKQTRINELKKLL